MQDKKMYEGKVVSLDGFKKPHICYAVTDRFAFLCPFTINSDLTLTKEVKETLVFNVDLANGNTPIHSIVTPNSVSVKVNGDFT